MNTTLLEPTFGAANTPTPLEGVKVNEEEERIIQATPDRVIRALENHMSRSSDGSVGTKVSLPALTPPNSPALPLGDETEEEEMDGRGTEEEIGGIVPDTPDWLMEKRVLQALNDPAGSNDFPTPALHEGFGEEELDGWFSDSAMKAIKTVVYHLLDLVLLKFRKERCYGCQVNHPSQTQHECLEDAPDDLYSVHFHQLTRRLYNRKFVPAIRHFLAQNHIEVEDHRIITIAGTLLHELKTDNCVYDCIERIYSDRVADNKQKIALLDTVADMWDQ